MPVAVQSQPVAIPEYLLPIPSITEDILNDSLSKSIPDEIIENSFLPLHDQMTKELGIKDPGSIKFDPKKHILFTDDFYEKTKRWTLEDLAVKEFHQEPITDIGVSEPFPLFTDEAVAIMRWEVLKKETVKFGGRYADTTNSKGNDIDIYVRGHAKDYAPFTYAAWHHPETLKIISNMSNVELVHTFDFELAHANITVKPGATAEETEEAIADEESEDEEGELDPNKMRGSVTWHYDSPQMVCVLMLSDTSKMTGGETALLMGNGKVAKVNGPKRGWATVLQGRILKHIATQPKGNYTERITSIGSLRPKDPLKENSFATTIRPRNLSGSRYNDWYQDFVNYKMDVLIERIQVLKKDINDSVARGEKFDQLKTIEFLQKNVIEYVEHSYQEFDAVEDGVVPKPASYNQIKSRWDNEKVLQ